MKLLFNTFLFLTVSFTCAFAHPHTFIEVEPTVKIKKETIEKLHIKWILDEMTSMMLIMELDVNGDGKFDSEENSYIYENYFSSLSQQNFYMQIKNSKQKFPINPKKFKASIEKEKLVYSFDIEDKIDLEKLKIKFFDEDLFVGMMLEKKSIKITGIEKEYQNRLKKEIFGVK